MFSRRARLADSSCKIIAGNACCHQSTLHLIIWIMVLKANLECRGEAALKNQLRLHRALFRAFWEIRAWHSDAKLLISAHQFLISKIDQAVTLEIPLWISNISEMTNSLIKSFLMTNTRIIWIRIIQPLLRILRRDSGLRMKLGELILPDRFPPLTRREKHRRNGRIRMWWLWTGLSHLHLPWSLTCLLRS